MEPFRFRERMRFDHVKDAFLLYEQASWLLEDDAPLHFERGVVRSAGEGRVELVLAHPNGVAEVAEGTIHGTHIDVVSSTVARSATASRVTALARRYRVEDDVLTYQLDMATETQPLTFHVRGELRR